MRKYFIFVVDLFIYLPWMFTILLLLRTNVQIVYIWLNPIDWASQPVCPLSDIIALDTRSGWCQAVPGLTGWAVTGLVHLTMASVSSDTRDTADTADRLSPEPEPTRDPGQRWDHNPQSLHHWSLAHLAWRSSCPGKVKPRNSFSMYLVYLQFISYVM